MREIKFMVWDKKDKVMFLNVLPITKGMTLYGEYSGYVFLPINDKRYIFLQYTGLKDKDGKEIYEGDIVKISEFDDMDTGDETIHKVEYFGNRDYPAFDLKPSLDVESNGLSHCIATCFIEIIGNIYENPEMIK